MINNLMLHVLQLDKLPTLPSNAKYVQHKNECYDWGTFGWLLLKSGHVSPSKYKYIVLTNSSVRGPYLPPYVPVRSSVFDLWCSK